MTTPDTPVQQIEGFRVDIWRLALCEDSLDGISHHCKTLTVVGLVEPGTGETINTVASVFAPTDQTPPVVLVITHDTTARRAHLEPVDIHDGRIVRIPGATLGTNYAGTLWPIRDELTELLGYRSPDLLPIHDRYEH